MLSVLAAIFLFVACVVGVYWLLRSMGQDGVEAAAPGSCKSGRCGVQPRQTAEIDPQRVQGQVVRIDEIQRKDAFSNRQMP
ncbi:MAG: hypothetical protein MUC79_08835 [Thiobacillaceae bacterium]|jgi:hypothetical protein|nr:hypothetical protein [Thiobacillaceae bacterium]